MELNGTAPEDSTLAYAGFMIGMSQKTLMEMLPEDAIETALDTIQTATETKNSAEERSANNIQNHPSEPLENDTLTSISTLFKTTWPDHLSPDTSLCESLWEAAGHDMSLIVDVITTLEVSTDTIRTPPVLVRYILQSTDPSRIREQAEIVRRKIDDTTHIQRALREADRKMREAEKPTVTQEHIERLEALRGRLRG